MGANTKLYRCTDTGRCGYYRGNRKGYLMVEFPDVNAMITGMEQSPKLFRGQHKPIAGVPPAEVFKREYIANVVALEEAEAQRVIQALDGR